MLLLLLLMLRLRLLVLGLLVMLLRLLVLLLVLQKLHELLLLLQHSQRLGIELRSTLLDVLEVIGLRLLESWVWRELERHLWLHSTLEVGLLLLRVLRVLGLLLCVLCIRSEGLGHPVWLLGLLVHWLAVGSSGLCLRLRLGLVG